MADAAHDFIQIERPRDEVAVIYLNQPDRLNALTPQRATAFVAALERLGSDRSCRAIIVSGRGRGFCAGLDLRSAAESSGIAGDDVMELVSNQHQFSAMPRAIRNAPVPVIAAVNGPAAGAGMGIALACDIRVAGESAEFHVAAVKLGLSAGECGMSYNLPRCVGASRALEMMLTGRPVGADEAARIGLVSRTVPDGEVIATALDIAESIAGNAPHAVAETKAIVWQNIDSDFASAVATEDRAQIIAAQTRDCAEAMSAFVDRRAPVFTGR